MAEKFTLREPDLTDDLDLSDSWKFQLRDAFGRWTSGGGSSPDPKFKPKFDAQFKRVERSRTLTPHIGGHEAKLGLRDVTVHGEAKWVAPQDVRHTLTMDHQSREMFFEAAGLRGSFKESDTELLHKWHEAKDPQERAAIEHELDVRLKAVSLGLATVQQANLEAKRANKRDYFKRFDAHLSKSKMGQAFLKFRDRLTSDNAFDAAARTKERVKEWGKDATKEFATSRALQVLVSIVSGFAVHMAGSESASEAVRSFTENPVAEAGIGALISIGLVLAAKAARGSAKKAAKTAPVIRQKLRREV